MLVMLVERSPTSLRGLLSRWLVEVRSGVFLGNPSSRIREILWRTAIHRNVGGYTVQIWSDRNPQGFSYRTFGKGTAELTDFEGLCLVRRVPRSNAPAENEPG